MADKAAFRAAVTARERQIPEQDRLDSDARLRARFLDLPRVKRAGTILAFAGMGLEVDTAPLLEELSRRGVRLLLPRCLPDHAMEARVYDPARLVRHRYGMLEPDLTCTQVPSSEIDLVLVPALCYDRQCFRMGRGGGYYDRFLETFAGCSVGLCRAGLLADRVPREDWDRPVQLVLTETETIAAN